MGNSENRKFLPLLKRAKEESDPILQEHAEWAIGKLMSAKMG
jgi:epoxyqueuosine reductase QueG